METSKRSYFTDSKGRGFPGTISNRTEQVYREGSGMEPQDFTRSFTTHTGPKGRLTSTQVETPTYRSSRFIYPGGSGYETINGVEKPIQLTGGGQDFMPSFVNKIKEGYQQVEPYLPDVDIGDKSIGYDYERPMGPGILSIGGEYDFDDNEYGLDFGYKFAFDDGGIATLAGDLEQRMTPQDPQQMDPKKLTDEQKDYLYDYMLDFMFKQKQREKMENESRVPPFNYFNMEV